MKRSSFVRTWILAALLLATPGGPAMADTACFSKHTSGGTSVPFKICISAHGNLVRLESAGEEEIRVGEIGEGYALCSGAGPTLHGFDAGFDEAGFGQATITQPGSANTFPLTIKRDTTDGIFRVVQTIDWRPAEREVSITMRIKNLSNTARNDVRVIRYFDGDMNGTAGNDNYESTTSSAYAVEDGFSYSVLSLTGLTYGISVAGGSVPRSFWDPHDCNPSGFIDNPEDGVGWVTYNLGTIGAGKSKSVDLVYRAF